MRRVMAGKRAALCAAISMALMGCEPAAMPSGEDISAAAGGGESTPKPEELLRRTTEFYGKLPAFACRVESTMRIQAQGMNNRMDTKMTVRLQRPNRFAFILSEGLMGMTIVSDGKQVWQYMPMFNRYAVRDAPPDLSALSDEAGASEMTMMGGLGALIPADGEEFYDRIIQGVKSSEYLGEERVGGALCHHCRFVQDEFSWEIWIETGERPLVYKIVPDFSKQFADSGGMFQDAKLDYSITFADWDVTPKFTEADFAFQPPAGAEKVESLLAGLGGGAAEEAPHPLLGQPAPPFQTVDMEGQAIDLQQHLGNDVILLDFWATWCGPCVRALPDVDAVAEKYADRGVVFYAVNVGEDAATAKKFLTESKLDVPVAMDPDGNIGGLYQVEGIPQTVLVGKDGTVQLVHVGFSEHLGNQLTQNIEDLLAGKDLAGEVLAKRDADQNQSDDSPPAESASEPADNP